MSFLAGIETKVWAPAVTGLFTAVIGLLISLGLDISQDLQNALLAVLAAVIVVVTVVTGYWAPHTPRSDVVVEEVPELPQVESASLGNRW